MTSKSKLPSRLQDEITHILSRSSRPLGALEIAEMVKGRYTLSSIRNRLGLMAVNEILIRTDGARAGHSVYQMRPKRDVSLRVREFIELQPMRPTVIPVRERGRMAPDISDGIAVGMGSVVTYSRRIEA